MKLSDFVETPHHEGDAPVYEIRHAGAYVCLELAEPFRSGELSSGIITVYENGEEVDRCKVLIDRDGEIFGNGDSASVSALIEVIVQNRKIEAAS